MGRSTRGSARGSDGRDHRPASGPVSSSGNGTILVPRAVSPREYASVKASGSGDLGPRALEPRGRPHPDGGLARVPHRIRQPGDRAARDAPVRRVPGQPRRRCGVDGAREALGQGLRDPVRRRRGERDRSVVLARPVLAPAHGPVGERDRAPVRARGVRVLPRGDLPRDLPVRLGPALAVDALVVGRPGRDLGGRERVVRRHRERVDAHAGRLRARG